MAKKKKKTKVQGKLAIGICVDGLYLRVACLLKRKDGIHIIDAQNVALAGPIESAENAHAQAEGLGLECLAGESFDLESDDLDGSALDLSAEFGEVESNIKVDSKGNLSGPAKTSNISEKSFEMSLPDDEGDNDADAMPIDLEFLLEENENSPLTSEDSDNMSDGNGFEMLDMDMEMEMEPEGDDIAIDISDFEDEEDEGTETDLLANLEDDALDVTSLDITDELKNERIAQAKRIANKEDNASILMNLLNRYPGRNFEIAISLPEPQIYYSYFESDWGLSGRKLKTKISQELFKERPDSETIKPEAINALPLADGHLMAVVREPEIGILNLLEMVRISSERRLPKISVVESVEISLVNLIKSNYNFGEEEISVVVFVGNDFSRLIFMRGNELYHISPIIGEGIDSFLVFGHSLKELGNTIHSRLLLEQDDLNLPTINNVILAGDACRAEIKNMLSSWFTEDIHIEELQFSNFQKNEANAAVLKHLNQVPVAVGAALRALETSNKDLYHLDLIPNKIKESQKVFKLGPIGWILLGLIPGMTFYMTTHISQMDAQIKTLDARYQFRKVELEELQHYQDLVDAASKKLSYYQTTFGVLDSMVAGTKTWSEFLKKTAVSAKNIGGIWITELSFMDNYKASVKGYSLFRNKISPFTESLGNASLNQVQVQDIRGKDIYYFEIEARVPVRN
ncbi:hypothetical protein JW960_03260 [candidate division KSB1 bacterium]|nr:hypothetical protein [candidate division KSB1 bacterium]